MSDEHRRLLNETEAGELLAMNPRRVARLAKRGELPTVALPDRELRFDPRDLWDWVERHKTGGVQP